MTLILTTLWHQGVSQVSDRLLSRKLPVGITPFDALSNKTILFAARDAFVTMSYWGNAYVGERPTDEWIAETLYGRPIPRGHDGERPAMMRVSTGRKKEQKWPSIGQALERLSLELQNTFDRLKRPAPSNFVLGIAIAGWQMGKRPRTFGLSLSKGVGPTVVERIPRHLGRRICLFAEPAGGIRRDEQNDTLAAIRTAKSIDEVEQAVVNGVRRVGKRSATVGPHCLCTTLLHPSTGWARVRYDPVGPQSADIVNVARGTKRRVPAAFSPWIVTEGFLMAPSVIVGGAWRAQVGPWDVGIESPAVQGTAAVSSQRRPKLPK